MHTCVRFLDYNIIANYIINNVKNLANIMQGNKIMYFIGVGGSTVIAMFAAFMAFG